MLWIREILVPVRVPLTYGSGSCFFRQWLTRCQQKISFCFPSFFACIFLKVHLHQSPKIENLKIVEFKVFFTYFACWCNHGRIPIREAQNIRILRIRILIHITDKYMVFDLIRTQFVVFFLFRRFFASTCKYDLKIYTWKSCDRYASLFPMSLVFIVLVFLELVHCSRMIKASQ